MLSITTGTPGELGGTLVIRGGKTRISNCHGA